MLKGLVNVHGEPVVPVRLILKKRPVGFRAVIGTGFNGYDVETATHGGRE
jgi:hypothetical protein